MTASLSCDRTGCPATLTLAVDAKDKTAVRAAGEAAGWFHMWRKGGKSAWSCPACKPDGKPVGAGLSAGYDGIRGPR